MGHSLRFFLVGSSMIIRRGGLHVGGARSVVSSRVALHGDRPDGGGAVQRHHWRPWRATQGRLGRLRPAPGGNPPTHHRAGRGSARHIGPSQGALQRVGPWGVVPSTVISTPYGNIGLGHPGGTPCALPTPEASSKIRKDNHQRLFDDGRRRVRAWEKASIK